MSIRTFAFRPFTVSFTSDNCGHERHYWVEGMATGTVAGISADRFTRLTPCNQLKQAKPGEQSLKTRCSKDECQLACLEATGKAVQTFS